MFRIVLECKGISGDARWQTTLPRSSRSIGYTTPENDFDALALALNDEFCDCLVAYLPAGVHGVVTVKSATKI
jgi:hypothetical protein